MMLNRKEPDQASAQAIDQAIAAAMATITALEAQRATLGDAVVNTAPADSALRHLAPMKLRYPNTKMVSVIP